jgi:hypothetical protein
MMGLPEPPLALQCPIHAHPRNPQFLDDLVLRPTGCLESDALLVIIKVNIVLDYYP